MVASAAEAPSVPSGDPAEGGSAPEGGPHGREGAAAPIVRPVSSGGVRGVVVDQNDVPLAGVDVVLYLLDERQLQLFDPAFDWSRGGVYLNSGALKSLVPSGAPHSMGRSNEEGCFGIEGLGRGWCLLRVAESCLRQSAPDRLVGASALVFVGGGSRPFVTLAPFFAVSGFAPEDSVWGSVVDQAGVGQGASELLVVGDLDALGLPRFQASVGLQGDFLIRGVEEESIVARVLSPYGWAVSSPQRAFRGHCTFLQLDAAVGVRGHVACSCGAEEVRLTAFVEGRFCSSGVAVDGAFSMGPLPSSCHVLYCACACGRSCIVSLPLGTKSRWVDVGEHVLTPSATVEVRFDGPVAIALEDGRVLLVGEGTAKAASDRGAVFRLPPGEYVARIAMPGESWKEVQRFRCGENEMVEIECMEGPLGR